MAISGKKIPAVPTWNGDQSMRIHAAKPGISEAVSIAEIVAAAANQAGGGSQHVLGEVVLRPTGVYPDFVSLEDEPVFDPVERSDLRDIFGETEIFLPGSLVGYPFEQLGAVYQVVRSGDALIFSFYDRFVYVGANVYAINKGQAFGADNRIIETRNGIYGFDASTGVAKLFRFGISGAAYLSYEHPIPTDLAYDIGLKRFNIVSHGLNDILFYPDQPAFKLIQGDVVSDISVGESVTGGRFSFFSGSAATETRAFFAVYDTVVSTDSIVELEIQNGIYELVSVVMGRTSGEMKCNDQYLFILSNMARGGSIYNELERYSLTDFSLLAVPEFLEYGGKNLSVTDEKIYFMEQGKVYEGSVEDMFAEMKPAKDYGFQYAQAMYVDDSGLVLASEAVYSELVKGFKVDLPLFESPTQSLKYYMKI